MSNKKQCTCDIPFSDCPHAMETPHGDKWYCTLPTKTNSNMENVLNEIKDERLKQEAKWGQQNHPILDPILLDRPPVRMCQEYEIPSENRARQMCETHANRGDLTYMHILMEEVSEAASCGRNTSSLRKELIQVAAVAVAMVESLDRNGN